MINKILILIILVLISNNFAFSEIEDCTINDLKFQRSSFQSLIILQNTITSIQVDEVAVSFDFLLTLKNNCLIDIKRKNLYCRNLHIVFDDFNGVFNLRSQSIERIDLYGNIEADGAMLAQDIKFNQIYFNDNSTLARGKKWPFSNQGNIEFINLSPQSEFVHFTNKGVAKWDEFISNIDSNETSKPDKIVKNPIIFSCIRSKLGNIHFSDFPFSQIDEIIFNKTSLSEISFFNSTIDTTKLIGSNTDLYEITNELTKIADKQNNRKDQLEYYKASRKFLLKSLLNKKWWKRIPSIFSLLFSLLYSNFGSNWALSLFLTTPLIALLFFSLMMTSSFSFSLDTEGWNGFKELSVYFIQFLNPTHKLSFMDNVDVFNNYLFSHDFRFVFFNLLGRIFVGIGIYETIISFRKWHR